MKIGRWIHDKYDDIKNQNYDPTYYRTTFFTFGVPHKGVGIKLHIGDRVYGFYLHL